MTPTPTSTSKPTPDTSNTPTPPIGGQQDKVVLITGASAGIGRSAADRLAARGWTVRGASRRGTNGSGWSALVMDVDSDESVAAGVESVVRANGRLDAVVACAGWGLAGPVEDTPLADAKAQLETNFWGAVRLTQAALPVMRARGGGRIVLVSSIGGAVGIPFQAFYSASKFAMEGFGEALAYEVAPFDIDVALVQPGNVATDFTASRRDVPVGADDPYAAANQKAVSKMAADEAAGIDPGSVADTIVRALESRRPPRRLSAGHPGERIGLLAKRLLPYRVFEWGAKGSLGV
jgi:NAD(P)-dependent dehydrogenase (short-subunit alcohol dehydrogenase family)